LAEDLEEIKERLDYCVGERNELAAQVVQHFNTYLERRVIDSPSPGRLMHQVRLSRALPKAISFRVGHIIHEVRSSLDALACVLAARNGKDAKDVYFPISKTEKALNNYGVKGLKKLSAADRNAIMALKPHGDANPILFGMHDFDRTRKHQRLLASSNGGRAGYFVGDFEGALFVDIEEFTTNWQPIAFVRAGVFVDFKVGVDIVFREPSQLKRLPVLIGRDQFIIEAQNIVRMFD